MKIGLLYFSPTKNTASIAAVIKTILENLKNEVKEFDITNYSERLHNLNLEQLEAIIFGFPNYYGRAPQVIREWLLSLEGKGKKCSVFFTYGGVHTGIGHNNIKGILNKRKFILVSTAEFVCKHTFNITGWKLNEHRPNQEDFEIAKDYTLKTYNRFIGIDSGTVSFNPIKLTDEKADQREIATKRAIPIPYREKKCTMCQTCEELCPTNAMNAEKGKPNRTLCIRCLRCVVNCPENVLKTKDMTSHLQLLMQANKLTEEIINSRKSKIFL